MKVFRVAPIVMLMAAVLTSSYADRDEVARAAVEVPDLKTRLEKDLMARRPEEFAFLNKVIELVNAKTLPLKMVNSTYLWARVKRPYPFVYFQQALTTRAARIGVKL